MKRIRVRDVVYRSLLTAIVLLFVYSVIWSDVGFLRYYSIKKDIGTKLVEVAVLKRETTELKERIEAWNQSPFYLEKTAREELGMGGSSEIVYLY